MRVKKDTPAERLAQMRDSAAKAREARSLAAAKRRAPACHPDRPQVGKTGLCHECYVGGQAGANLSLQDAMKLADKHKDPMVGQAIRDRALAVLVERLPDYADMHFEAAKMAALKGNAEPAQWALTTVKSAGGAAVVEPPTKGPADAGGVKIIIGVKLGGLERQLDASNPVDAQIVPDAPTS